MEVKKRMIFNNELDLEQAREFLKEVGCEEPTDDEVLDEAVFQSQTWWEDEYERILETFPGFLVARGTITRWTGPKPGVAIYKNFHNFMKHFLKDCDEYEFYDKNGHFFVKGIHHDGTNTCEIKPLEAAGKQFYDNWLSGVEGKGYNCNEYEMSEKLFKTSMYSKIPHYAHKYYGCKVREYEKEAN